jgi:hypothetical protein
VTDRAGGVKWRRPKQVEGNWGGGSQWTWPNNSAKEASRCEEDNAGGGSRARIIA